MLRKEYKRNKYILIVYSLFFSMIIPIIGISIINSHNKTTKNIEEYCKYLYFNWIDYPNPAEKMNGLSEDVNEKLFEWFGYSENGQPIKERYLMLKFQYKSDFLLSENSIGIPFLSGNKLIYKKLIVEKGEIISTEESIW